MDATAHRNLDWLMHETTDDALLLQLAAGDRSALATLVERHGPSMISLAERVTGSAGDAEEIVQEAFLKAWRQAFAWQSGGGARFSSWLYRVVLNASIDRRRRGRRYVGEPSPDIAEDVPNGHERFLQRQRAELLRAALVDVPRRQREALVLRYLLEQSVPDTAARLGLSVSSTAALLARGRRSLREGLRRRGFDDLKDVL